jgi:hypothetical protein
MCDRGGRHPGRNRMKTLSLSFGSLTRSVPLRPRSRNDDAYLFSNPVNAALLGEAMEDSLARRNMIPFTVEQLRRDLGLEEA